MADSSLGTAVLRTRLDTSGLKTGLNRAKGETQRFTQDSATAIRGIGAAFGAVAASAGVRSYISFLSSSATLAHQADAAHRLYEKSLQRTNQSTEEGARLVDRLSQRFGVASSVIEDAATLMLRQGASLDDVERALTAAGASAAAAGFDISTAFNNVSTAVATGRSELLETSGIVANLGPVAQQYAKSVGKTVEELTQQELIQARVNAIYRETASEIEDVDEILQGLPLAQANVTREFRTFREDVGGIAQEVIVPLTNAFGAVLRFVNDMPEPVKRVGLAMSGAAIGATALATGIIAIKAALPGLQALGLASFGPAGWIVLGVTAVAGLVAVLTGRQDSLDAAIGKASAALAGGDTDSLDKALEKVAGKVEDPLRSELEKLRTDMRNTGDVGVEMAERINDALTQAATAPLRAELETVRREAETIERLLGTVQSPDAINARIAEIEREGNAILDAGGEVPLATINELTMLRGLAADLEISAATLARDQERLVRLREREAELLAAIETASGPGVSVPDASPEPPAGPVGSGPSGTDSDPVSVKVNELPEDPRFATADARARATITAVEKTAGVFTSVAEGLRELSRAGVVLTPELVTALEARIAARGAAPPAASAPAVIGLPDPLDFSSLTPAQRLEAERLTNTLDGAVEGYVDALEEEVKRTTPRSVVPEVRAIVAQAVAIPTPASASENFRPVNRFGFLPDRTFELETERFLNFANQIDLVTTNSDRAAEAEARLAQARERLAEIGEELARTEERAWRDITAAVRFGGSAAVTYTEQLQLQARAIELAAEKGITLTQALQQLNAERDLETQKVLRATDLMRSRESGGTFSRDNPNFLRDSGQAARDRAQDAADRFAETVVDAGFRMGDAAIQAIRDGDIGGILRAGLSGAASIAGNITGLSPIPFLGGAINPATLIAGGIGLFGTLLGALLGGNQSQEAQRAAGAATRGAPAVELNLVINQSLNVQSLTDPASRNAINGLLDQTVRRLADVVERNIIPRITRLEGAA